MIIEFGLDHRPTAYRLPSSKPDLTLCSVKTNKVTCFVLVLNSTAVVSRAKSSAGLAVFSLHEYSVHKFKLLHGLIFLLCTVYVVKVDFHALTVCKAKTV